MVEGADAELRNEYSRWIGEYVAALAPADQAKGNKHIEEFMRLHDELTAEEHLRAEESAA